MICRENCNAANEWTRHFFTALWQTRRATNVGVFPGGEPVSDAASQPRSEGMPGADVWPYTWISVAFGSWHWL